MTASDDDQQQRDEQSDYPRRSKNGALNGGYGDSVMLRPFRNSERGADCIRFASHADSPESHYSMLTPWQFASTKSGTSPARLFVPTALVIESRLSTASVRSPADC